MSKLNTLGELLIHNVKDLYSAETQLVKALPKMAKAANDPDLKKGFEGHLEETKVHVTRLEQVAELLGASPRGLSCKAMKGLVEEGEEAIKEEADEHIKDLALIAAAQKVEHYEISGYGTARALAEAIGNKEVAKLLKTTEDEEGATDKKLTTASEKIIASAPVED
ncbi:ferritin-like domain-containing protein [Luteolibacter sp. SL250]|uniref:YciE/YciF ferroxidase family protein n=1 Tax=Luteolibacter sp. SL250 TaxID=2995170 RepID=UPI002271ABB7|nr:ferritin-like domain-containing protein [Luteolibacter sp. SL250]WAC19073.1 ferritin-like domain-containing protein [Luteolibacter sp. SL250]